MSEEIIGQGKDSKDNGGGNGGLTNNTSDKKESTPETPSSDFKVAEIWIKSGQIQLEATESFWHDKCRAIGLLSYCVDIVKNAKLQPENKVIPMSKIPHAMMQFARSGFRKRRK